MQENKDVKIQARVSEKVRTDWDEIIEDLKIAGMVKNNEEAVVMMIEAIRKNKAETGGYLEQAIRSDLKELEALTSRIPKIFSNIVSAVSTHVVTESKKIEDLEIRNKMSEELRSTELNEALRKLQERNQTIHQLEEASQNFDEEKKLLQGEIDRLSELIEGENGLNRKIEEKDKLIQDTNSRLTKAETENEKLQELVSSFDEEKEKLNNLHVKEVKKYQDEITDLNKDLKDTRSSYQELLRTFNQTLDAERQQSQKRFDAAEEEHKRQIERMKSEYESKISSLILVSDDENK